MSTQRPALAPLRDSSLNISSPLKHRKGAAFMPLTPNGLSYQHQKIQRQVDQAGVQVQIQAQQTPKTTVHPRYMESHQSLTPDSTSTTPPPCAIDGEVPAALTPPAAAAATQVLLDLDKRETANLAATKLKIELQLAVYKLQKVGAFQSRNSSYKDSVNKAFIATSVNINLQIESMVSSTPKPAPVPAAVSAVPAAVLQAKLTRTKPSLSATAYDKNLLHFKNSQKLRLYSIKKDSRFYGERRAIPLVPRAVGASATSSMGQYLDTSSAQVSTSGAPAFALPPVCIKTAKSGIKNNSNNDNNYNNHTIHKPLPPINKILKTPLKSSSRDLINAYLPNGQYQPFNIHTDDTIDEDDDGPLRESTSNSIKVGDSKKNDSENENDSKDILSSSPIHITNNNNAFGTPNSFSVAKSLLQLGSGFY